MLILILILKMLLKMNMTITAIHTTNINIMYIASTPVFCYTWLQSKVQYWCSTGVVLCSKNYDSALMKHFAKTSTTKYQVLTDHFTRS